MRRRRRELDTAGMTLRQTVMRSAALLVVRESGGIALRLVGVLIVTRLIGPTDYGLFAGPAAIAGFIAIAANAGADIYLLRREEEPTDDDYHQVFWVIAAWSLLVTAAALAAVPGVRVVLPDHRFVAPYVVLVSITPINVLWVPAQAKLERHFRYREMATIELVGDTVLYAVAIALAIARAGLWAPVAGYIAWQAWLLIGASAYARYRPRWVWTNQGAWRTFRDGIGFSSSTLIDSVGDLANPLIVGHFLGATAVGFVALASRICDVCTFIRRVLWRLSVVAFAKIQRDTQRLRTALQDGMSLQLLAVGPLLGAACVTAPFMIPLAFGRQWTPTVAFLPYLAISALVNNAFLAHTSVLMVRNRIAAVVRINVASFCVLFVTSWTLVPHLGIKGYGVAQIGAALASCTVAHFEVRRLLSPSYRTALPWFAACAPLMGAPYLDIWWRALVLAPAALVVLLPSERRELARQLGIIRLALRRQGHEVAADVSSAGQRVDVPSSHLPGSTEPL